MKSNPNRACLKRSTKPAARQGKQTITLYLRTRSLPGGGDCYQLAAERTGRVFLSLVMKPELPAVIKLAERRGVSLIVSLVGALYSRHPHAAPQVKRQWMASCLRAESAARQGKQTLGLRLRARSLPSGGDCYQLAFARTGRVFLSLVMERELPALLKVDKRRAESLMVPIIKALGLNLPHQAEPEIKGQGRAAA